MSLFLLRNNLRKFQSCLHYAASRNTCLLREVQKPYQNSCSLIGKQIFNPNKEIIRKGTTITVKQYESSRKYTSLWKAERFAGVSLIFLIPLAFCIESKELEMALGVVAIAHTYWGCQSMCNDYVRSSVVGKVLPILARLLNISLTLATLIGIHHLIYEDCGIVNMIKKCWAIRGKDYVKPTSKEEIKANKNK